uniref:N-acetyltransferase domain-containing protein n=1 Tax=Plectus sambesii TaxID=2011161 RepID=A0A914VS61_9BILA
MTACRLVPLSERLDLQPGCIALLNSEWPRSVASREHSLQKAANPRPPMSLLLLNGEGELIGHSKLCDIPGRPSDCWIESVVIRTDLRGLGLGKELMLLTENVARSFKFTNVFLSTEDKEAFYAKSGYVCCEPIVTVGANSKLLDSAKFGKFMKDMGVDKREDDAVEKKRLKESAMQNVADDKVDSHASTLPALSGPPPPPPPPPLLTPSVAKVQRSSTQFMRKAL